MQGLKRRTRHQGGQAYVEYVVALGLLVGALVVGGDTSVMNTLLVSLKSFFDAYGYALSLS
ncbi:hypothetical protein [Burkholderia gladioli]|uniref:hypothetical protein n=1 Tax=Burkholderia gladioli TaxID=28095 RepID=UPI00163F3C64|nr:hypothetical protein [Burkholderia gladioli]MDN7916986.1 hypothetical protein [Burkholderia gladioli]